MIVGFSKNMCYSFLSATKWINGECNTIIVHFELRKKHVLRCSYKLIANSNYCHASNSL